MRIAEISYLQGLHALWEALGHDQRRILTFLAVLMVSAAILEGFIVGSVLPLVESLMASECVEKDFLSYRIDIGLDCEAAVARWGFLVGFLVCILASAALKLWILKVSTFLAASVGNSLAVRVYENSLTADYKTHLKNNSSDTISAGEKVQMVISGVLMPFLQVVVSLALVMSIALMLFIIDSELSISIIVLTTIFYSVVVYLVRRRLSANSRIFATCHQKKLKLMAESFGGIIDLIMSGSQANYVENFSRLDREMRSAQASNNIISTLPKIILETAGLSAIVCGSFFIAMSSTGGFSSSIPLLGAFALGAQRAMPLIQQVYLGWSKFKGNVKLLDDVLKRARCAEHKPLVLETLDTWSESLVLENISFKYDADSKFILDDVSLEIKKGEIVGVKGTTGGGKSTLIGILGGLLSPSAGKILVDGTQLNASNVQSWRTQIAYLPQHIYLFDGTIRENLSSGADGRVDDSKLIRACAAAEILEFIRSLPEGLGTRVGEGGVRLSGGQKQRLGLARVLMRSPQILILDEATSALDVDTEEKIMGNLKTLWSSNLSIILVAHRLKTLEWCDKFFTVGKSAVRVETAAESGFGSIY